ncbi:MAG: hypothetical protein ACR652_10845 [Methylocystis sp.]|uniref:hypothetical protein n=1 Tax=Methylocystis sp. TaxID=1911079 RepID=UPI003DA642C0
MKGYLEIFGNPVDRIFVGTIEIRRTGSLAGLAWAGAEYQDALLEVLSLIGDGWILARDDVRGVNPACLSHEEGSA